MSITHYTQKQLEVNSWINAMGYRTDLEIPLGPYCCDIICWDLQDGWAFEIDGPQHYPKANEKRDQYLYQKIGLSNIIHVPVDITQEDFERKFREELRRKNV